MRKKQEQYVSTFPHCSMKSTEYLWPKTKRLVKEEAKVNYAFALKNYQQNGRGRSMKKFCEEEGYDYEKFMRYSRRGQKEYSVLKEADARQTSDKFIPLVVDGPAESVLGILDVRVRFMNGMELSQSEGDLNELFGMVRKMLG